MAQKVQLNKELVSKPAVQGSNDVRKLLMKIRLLSAMSGRPTLDPESW